MTASKARPRKNSKKDFPNPYRTVDRAYKRLGITVEQAESAPRIRDLLKRAGLGMDRVTEILSGDGSAEAQSFMAVYNKLSSTDRKRLPIEAIVVAANLSTRRLWEVLSGAAMQQGRDTVALMVSVAQAEVVARTIKSAKLPLGHYDREHLYRAVGFLPVNKGQQIFINTRPQEEEKPEEDTDGTGSLPTMDSYLLDIQRAISPAKTALPAPVPKTEEAEYTELPAGRLE
jgi:hypothetical protein